MFTSKFEEALIINRCAVPAQKMSDHLMHLLMTRHLLIVTLFQVIVFSLLCVFLCLFACNRQSLDGPPFIARRPPFFICGGSGAPFSEILDSSLMLFFFTICFPEGGRGEHAPVPPRITSHPGGKHRSFKGGEVFQNRHFKVFWVCVY